MKILFIYSEIGHGFKAPAISVKNYIAKHSPKHELSELSFFKDLGLEWQERFWRKVWAHSLKLPSKMFNLSYKISDCWILGYKISDLVFLTHYNLIKKKIKEINPDVIFSCWPIASTLLGHIRKKNNFDFKIINYAVDTFDIHYWWLCYSADLNLVSSKKGYNLMHSKGIKKKNLKFVYFPIDPKFENLKLTKSQCRKKLGIKNKLTAMLMSGGEGVGTIERFIESYQKANLNIQILIVCGKNKELYNKIKKIKNPNLIPFGFVKDMEVLYKASDLSIGKSGLSFAFESIAMGLPILVTIARGPEVHVKDYILKKQIGWYSEDLDRIADIILKIEKKNTILIEYQKNIKKLNYRSGVKEISELILTID